MPTSMSENIRTIAPIFGILRTSSIFLTIQRNVTWSLVIKLGSVLTKIYVDISTYANFTRRKYEIHPFSTLLILNGVTGASTGAYPCWIYPGWHWMSFNVHKIPNIGPIILIISELEVGRTRDLHIDFGDDWLSVFWCHFECLSCAIPPPR